MASSIRNKSAKTSKGIIRMRIGILGSGMVGRAHAERLVALGHDVVLGTQDVKQTLAKTTPDAMGNPPFSEWQKGKPKVQLATLAETAAHGEVIFNALNGGISVEALKKLETALRNKTLVDIANPLDFSKGMPPFLSVCNTDSLGERIQQALPGTRVVKAFNTMNAHLQVNPQQLAGGDHHAFLSGNDAKAKAQVIEIHKAYGWKNIIDLGDITTARGSEMLLPIWLRLWGALKDPMFNFKIMT